MSEQEDLTQTLSFRAELRSLLNRYSMENESNTPDFILADYLVDCLASWDRATERRIEWFDNAQAAAVTRLSSVGEAG